MNRRKLKREKKVFYKYVLYSLGIIFALIPNVMAAEENPITVINNLSDFIFQITRIVGIIIAGCGIIQFGFSLTGHDAQQRINGILFFVGGVIIIFAKPILDMLTK